jgi:PAS domain S-box-containing protein
MSGAMSVKSPRGVSGDGLRLMLGSRLERFGVFMRCFAYAVLAPMFFWERVSVDYRGLLVITVVILLHNIFVHYVLWRRRPELFLTPWNFVINLAEASIVVGFTGMEESEFFFLYFFMLIGYSVFFREFAWVLVATAICCAAYGVVLAWGYYSFGFAVPLAVVVLKLGSVAVCGWMMALLSRLWRQIEDAASARARALASSEATLRTILDSTADPILVYDEDEVIIEVNDKACEFLALSREAALGRIFRDFLFDDDSVSERLAEAKLRDEYHGEQVFVNADGVERTVDLHIRSFMQGYLRYYVAIAHDITERKNLQEATHLANANLGRLNMELQQVNELKTGLLTTFSQRIRSPLTATLGYLDMLLNDDFGDITPDQRKPLQNCRRITVRIFRLIDEALGAPPTDIPRGKE